MNLLRVIPAKGVAIPHPTHHHSNAPDVLIVGGGVIGLSVAWRARSRGMAVTLLDRGAFGQGTTRVAAGMLAPVSEADAGEPALLAAGLASAQLWPQFAAGLERCSGLDPGLRTCGTLVVARDADDVAWLERERALREQLGVPVSRLRGSEARRLEPALVPSVRAALVMPGDHAIDPRSLVAALCAACAEAGVTMRPGEQVESHDARGVTLAGGARIEAGRVVVATGPWSGAPVRPLKGQILRLRDPDGPGLLERVLRFRPTAAGARLSGGYVVPRGDGRYVIGATSEERGFDTAVTAGGVRELLAEAQTVLPGIDELELEEASAGLRPTTPDNSPLIGEVDGIVMAAGHHRHGVLLAPLTADAVVALLAGEEPPTEIAAFAPGRFAEVAR
jgi:glycine oxidase